MPEPVTLDINPFNHDDLDKKIKELTAQVDDLTSQLQVMTNDRNEFRMKFQNADHEVNDLTIKLAAAQARIAELEQEQHHSDPVDTGHHFG